MWYAIRRIVGSIPVLIVSSFLVFSLTHLAPGDPITLLVDDRASQETIDNIKAKWGLDQPVAVQYGKFLLNALTGDLGRSFRYNSDVTELILQRLPATLELAIVSMLIAGLIAMPIGIIAGWRPNSKFDNIGSVFGLFGVSMPSFWFGIMLILIFAGFLHLLPSAGRSTYGIAGEQITGFYTIDSIITGNWAALRDGLSYMILPAITLGTGMAGILMRITRSSVLEVSGEDYIRTARAKGVRERDVVMNHAVRSSMIPIVSVVGLELASLLNGSIISETVFAWPGIGSLLIQGVSARDYPLVTGIVLFYTVAFMLINIGVDLLYRRFDPRVRYA